MSNKLYNFNPSESLLPTKVTGDLAQYFLNDLAASSTREVEVLRAILQKRAARKSKNSSYDLSGPTQEVASTTIEE